MEKNEYQPWAPYISPTPGEITLLASSPVSYWREEIPESVFKELKECNFNATYIICTIGDEKLKENSLRSIINAKAAGINVIARNYFFNLGEPPKKNGIPISYEACFVHAKEFYNLFKKVDPNEPLTAGNDIIKGWCMKDEPDIDLLTQEPDANDGYNLRNIVQYMNNDGNTRPIQINLEAYISQDDWDKHINALKEFGLNLWSYDCYPITEHSCLLTSCALQNNCKLDVNYDKFYTQLERYSAMVSSHNKESNRRIAFWAYAQTMEHMMATSTGAFSHYHPAAWDRYLRFEVFSALAFGAQGIVYWTYNQREDSGNEVYLSALVNLNGQKMYAWYYAQRVNAEVKKYSHVFVNSNLEGYWYVKHPSVQTPSQFPKKCPIVSAFIMNMNTRCLVTSLTNASSDNYIVIVSGDVENSQDLTLYFSSDAKIKFITPIKSTGEAETEFHEPERPVTLNIVPGGYYIIQYDYESQ